MNIIMIPLDWILAKFFYWLLILWPLKILNALDNAINFITGAGVERILFGVNNVDGKIDIDFFASNSPIKTFYLISIGIGSTLLILFFGFKIAHNLFSAKYKNIIKQSSKTLAVGSIVFIIPAIFITLLSLVSSLISLISGGSPAVGTQDINQFRASNKTNINNIQTFNDSSNIFDQNITNLYNLKTGKRDANKNIEEIYQDFESLSQNDSLKILAKKNFQEYEEIKKEIKGVILKSHLSKMETIINNLKIKEKDENKAQQIKDANNYFASINYRINLFVKTANQIIDQAKLDPQGKKQQMVANYQNFFVNYFYGKKEDIKNKANTNIKNIYVTNIKSFTTALGILKDNPHGTLVLSNVLSDYPDSSLAVTFYQLATGSKNSDWENDFNINTKDLANGQLFFGSVLIIAACCFLVTICFMALVRLIDLALLITISPIPVFIAPIDGGERVSLWIKAFSEELLSILGAIIVLRLLGPLGTSYRNFLNTNQGFLGDRKLFLLAFFYIASLIAAQKAILTIASIFGIGEGIFASMNLDRSLGFMASLKGYGRRAGSYYYQGAKLTVSKIKSGYKLLRKRIKGTYNLIGRNFKNQKSKKTLMLPWYKKDYATETKMFKLKIQKIKYSNKFHNGLPLIRLKNEYLNLRRRNSQLNNFIKREYFELTNAKINKINNKKYSNKEYKASFKQIAILKNKRVEIQMGLKLESQIRQNINNYLKEFNFNAKLTNKEIKILFAKIKFFQKHYKNEFSEMILNKMVNYKYLDKKNILKLDKMITNNEIIFHQKAALFKLTNLANKNWETNDWENAYNIYKGITKDKIYKYSTEIKHEIDHKLKEIKKSAKLYEKMFVYKIPSISSYSKYNIKKRIPKLEKKIKDIEILEKHKNINQNQKALLLYELANSFERISNYSNANLFYGKILKNNSNSIDPVIKSYATKKVSKIHAITQKQFLKDLKKIKKKKVNKEKKLVLNWKDNKFRKNKQKEIKTRWQKENNNISILEKAKLFYLNKKLSRSQRINDLTMQNELYYQKCKFYQKRGNDLKARLYFDLILDLKEYKNIYYKRSEKSNKQKIFYEYNKFQKDRFFFTKRFVNRSEYNKQTLFKQNHYKNDFEYIKPNNFFTTLQSRFNVFRINRKIKANSKNDYPDLFSDDPRQKNANLINLNFKKAKNLEKYDLAKAKEFYDKIAKRFFSQLKPDEKTFISNKIKSFSKNNYDIEYRILHNIEQAKKLLSQKKDIASYEKIIGCLKNEKNNALEIKNVSNQIKQELLFHLKKTPKKFLDERDIEGIGQMYKDIAQLSHQRIFSKKMNQKIALKSQNFDLYLQSLKLFNENNHYKSYEKIINLNIKIFPNELKHFLNNEIKRFKRVYWETLSRKVPLIILDKDNKILENYFEKQGLISKFKKTFSNHPPLENLNSDEVQKVVFERTLNLANKQLKIKNYDNALNTYSELLKKNETNINALANKAFIKYYHFDDYQYAMINYQKILNLKPDSIKASTNYIICNLLLENYSKAIKICNDFSKNHSKTQASDSKIQELKVIAHIKLNENNQAFESYGILLKNLQLVNANSKIPYILEAYLLKQKDHNLLKNFISKTIENNHNPNIQLLLGHLYTRNGNLDKAVLEYNKILNDPNLLNDAQIEKIKVNARKNIEAIKNNKPIVIFNDNRVPLEINEKGKILKNKDQAFDWSELIE